MHVLERLVQKSVPTWLALTFCRRLPSHPPCKCRTCQAVHVFHLRGENPQGPITLRVQEPPHRRRLFSALSRRKPRPHISSCGIDIGSRGKEQLFACVCSQHWVACVCLSQFAPSAVMSKGVGQGAANLWYEFIFLQWLPCCTATCVALK